MNAQASSISRSQVEQFGHRHRTGVITVLFTDISGSMEAKQRLGDRAAAAVFEEHHQLVRQVLSQFPDGEEIETAGDSFLLVFARLSAAVRFALQLQTSLGLWQRESALKTEESIGIHLGEIVIAERSGDALATDIFGFQIDVCARVMSLAQAGQILMTRPVFDDARQLLHGGHGDGSGRLEWVRHGAYHLKGVDIPIEICEVREVGPGPRRLNPNRDQPRPPINAGAKPPFDSVPAARQRPSCSRPIVEAFKPECGSSLWRRFRSKSRIKAPAWEAATDLLQARFGENARCELSRLTPGDSGKAIEGTPWDVFYRVSTARFELDLSFAAIKRENGTAWDLVLAVSAHITDAKLFFESGAWNLASPGVPLLKPMLESWIANALASGVRDAAASHAIQYLRDENGLSPKGWLQQLNDEWLAGHGIRFENCAFPRWESMEAARVQAERNRQTNLERLQKQREQQQEAMLREQRLAAEFETARLQGEADFQKKRLQIEAELEQRKALLEHDRRLAQEAREHQPQRLEQERRPKLLEAEANYRAQETALRARLAEAEAETQRLEQAAEETALNHLLKMAELQEKLTAAKQARTENERKRLWDLRQQEESEKAAFIESQQKITHQTRVSEIERAQQLEAMQRQHQLRMAQMEEAVRTAQCSTQSSEAEYQLAFAKLQAEQQTLREIKAWQAESERQNAALRARLVEAEQKLAEVGERLGSFIGLLNNPDPRKATQAAAWLAHQGLTTKHLAALGCSGAPQKLLERLKERAGASGVLLKKMALRTRSINEALRDVSDPSEIERAAKSVFTRDIGTRRIDTLRINDPLEFEFVARCDGCVTLLNIGTSGGIFIHAPNVFVGLLGARVVSGRRYTVPGAEFLPREKIQGYWEGGPPGWEHLAVIVSAHPLVPDLWLKRSTTDEPFVRLSNSEAASFCDCLSASSTGSWISGVLSFFVA